MALSFSYPCVLVKQKEGTKDLLLFSASAIDINRWVGIPQRLSLGGNETSGFQRTVSVNREKALQKFFADDRNVIQNPLLCAIRQPAGVQVAYVPSEGSPELGLVTIAFEDYSTFSYLQLITAAREYLETRDPALGSRAAPTEIVTSLENQLGVTPAADINHGGVVDREEEDFSDTDNSEIDASEPAEEALFDESQITDFWDQLRAREIIANKAGFPERDDFLGFTKHMLQSYLRPIILVDGQHRLRGAILAANDALNNSEEAADLVDCNVPAQEASERLIEKYARRLPVSLLMNDSPAEHVFQYVLVNQKATAVPKALLGTIISTSLAEGELATIAQRLEDASIELQNSRIVSILARQQDSPFYDLVAKGLEGDGGGKLQWSVLGSLAEMFRTLSGGRLYHDTTDHAKLWRSHNLDESPIVGQWQAEGFSDPLSYWSDLTGPWMMVFKAFWTKTRDRLATVENPNAPNFWGNTRSSNIFNKPSLHILAADFFSFLRESKTKLADAQSVDDLVDGWLEYISDSYFARDWQLAGVKKDSVGTRRQWSKLWSTYRQSGVLPSAKEFSKVYKG